MHRKLRERQGSGIPFPGLYNHSALLPEFDTPKVVGEICYFLGPKSFAVSAQSGNYDALMPYCGTFWVWALKFSSFQDESGRSGLRCFMVWCIWQRSARAGNLVSIHVIFWSWCFLDSALFCIAQMIVLAQTVGSFVGALDRSIRTPTHLQLPVAWRTSAWPEVQFFFVSLNYWMCIIEPIELQLGHWTGRRRERWYDNWLSVSVVFLCAAYTIIGVSVMYQYRNPWPFLCLIKCNAHKSIIALPYFSDKTRAVKSTFFFSMSSLLKSIYSFKQDMEKQNDQINSIRSFLRVHLINYLAAGVLYRFWCLFVKGDSRLR